MKSLLPECLPLLADAPSGIRRLRDLILELAVAGRLVPQHASEETGHDLMLRIGALTDGFKWSKQAGVATSQLAETAHHLPATWASAQLGEIVEIVRGITFPAAEKAKVPAQGRIACLRTSNVQDRIEWDDLLYVDEKFVGRLDQMLQVSDIVMSMANSRELVGKVALVTDLPVEKASFGGFLGVIRPVLMEPRFVMALLRTPSARRALIDGASQTTNIANISLAKLRPLPVAVPSLAEQRRIVAKVDELMALCDRLEARNQDAKAAHARLVQTLLDSLTQARDADDFQACWQRVAKSFPVLFTTDGAIAALRRAVLRCGVSGRLTERSSSDKSADELRLEVAAVRGRLASAGRAWSLEDVEPASHADLAFEIPESWAVVRAAEICWPITSGSTPPASEMHASDGVPFLKVYNIRNQEIDFGHKPQFVSKSYHGAKLKRSCLQPGDIVMNIVGPPLGKIAIVPEHFPEWNCNQAIVGFRLIPPMVPAYLYLYLCEGSFLRGIELIGTAGQDNISVTKSKHIPIPVPPAEEQHRIVSKVTELLAFCDQLKGRIAAARAKHAQLAEAVVASAIAA